MRVLAIDQGTTSTRGVLFGPNGRQVVHAAEHRQIYPRPGWVEHDPEEILRELRTCLGRAEGAVAVGLANQGESCLAWEAETGAPVTNIIVWQDARTEARVARFRAEGAEPAARARSGLPLDPYFSGSKLGWIVETVPEARALAARGRLRLGTTDAFFLDRLAGRFVTDLTTASRTGLMDLCRGAWDPELCRLHGVPMEALPEIVPSAGELGVLGGPVGPLPLTASLVDQQAALYGHGCREAGDTKITFGTGAFALAVAGARVPEAAGALPTVAWQVAGNPPVYALEGGVYAASAAVNWARELGLFASYDEIDGFEGAAAIERGLVFVPALAGLACPHWDRQARGAWLGLGLETRRGDLVRAVLEGVALRAAEAVASMRLAAAPDRRVSIDGGMSANGYFTGFLAGLLGRPTAVSEDPELTARGAAELAAEAAGVELALPRPLRPVTAIPVPPDAVARFDDAVRLVREFGHRNKGAC